jgi:serine racemase
VTWPIVRDKVDDVIVVSEPEIVAAMKLIYERLKVVVEPSGAAGLAAALSDDFATRHCGCKSVGIILCGGNVDLDAIDFVGSWTKLVQGSR